MGSFNNTSTFSGLGGRRRFQQGMTGLPHSGQFTEKGQCSGAIPALEFSVQPAFGEVLGRLHAVSRADLRAMALCSIPRIPVSGS